MPGAILVIGAGGFVGQNLLNVLSTKNTRVIVATRHPLPPGAYGTAISNIGLLQHPAKLVPVLREVIAVVNLASASTPGSSADNPILEIEQNLRPLAILLNALQSVPQIPLIHMSSAGAISYRRNAGTSDEDSPVYSRSYHGAAKIAAEHLIEAWVHQFNGSATILRPSNIYGPGQPFRQGFGIIPSIFNSLCNSETVKIWGDGSFTRDYLFIDDLIGLLIKILAGAAKPGFNIYNACSGSSTSLNTLLEIIESITHARIKRDYMPERKIDSPSTIVSGKKTANALGWSANTEISDGLRATWNWFRDTHS